MAKNLTSKKNAMRMWLIALISAIFVLSTAFFIVYATSNNYVWDDINIENEYLVGDTLTIPTVKVSVGDKSYSSEFVLKHPNGKSYADEDNNLATESKFVLETQGIYKLVYIANVEGKIVETEKKFEVKEQLFSVSSKNSSVSYGVDSSIYQSGKTGLNLTLASGDYFKYGKVIDFNGKTSSDKIVTIIALPEVRAEMEVSGLLITLTDAYDANNYVEIQLKNSTDFKNTAPLNNAEYIDNIYPDINNIIIGV